MAADRVLEIQQSYTGGARTRGQPEQVFGMEIAVGEHRCAGFSAVQHRFPKHCPGRSRLGRRIGHAHKRRPPLQPEVQPHAQGERVVDRQRPRAAARDRQNGWRRFLMQSDQKIQGLAVHLSRFGAGVEPVAEEVRA